MAACGHDEKNLLLPNGGGSIHNSLANFAVGTNLSKSYCRYNARANLKDFGLIRNFQYENPKTNAKNVLRKKEGIENNTNNNDNIDETNSNDENGDDIDGGENNNSDNMLTIGVALVLWEKMLLQKKSSVTLMPSAIRLPRLLTST